MNGSEHTVNKHHYQVEVSFDSKKFLKLYFQAHFVHKKNGSQIPSEQDSLAVIGVFLAIGNDGSALKYVDDALKNVVEPSKSK